mmetsp:Transcript_56998/g.146954  ORF Transcript_56998/g.146954 Transcript_56998/m.146954 type:complete len:236 (-) Transcript_56998:170-877(-)
MLEDLQAEDEIQLGSGQIRGVDVCAEALAVLLLSDGVLATAAVVDQHVHLLAEGLQLTDRLGVVPHEAPASAQSLPYPLHEACRLETVHDELVVERHAAVPIQLILLALCHPEGRQRVVLPQPPKWLPPCRQHLGPKHGVEELVEALLRACTGSVAARPAPLAFRPSSSARVRCLRQALHEERELLLIEAQARPQSLQLPRGIEARWERRRRVARAAVLGRDRRAVSRPALALHP